MGENEKLAEGTFYIVEPDGTKTPFAKIGETLEFIDFESADDKKVGSIPGKASGTITWEKATSPDWDKIFKAAAARYFTELIMLKYSRIIHLMRHGKTERVRKKNSHRLDRMITKEINKYARVE